MRRLNRILKLFVCLLLVNVTLLTIPSVVQAPEVERTWANSVSVTTGTPNGIVDNTVGADGVYFSVVEVDTNDGLDYQNDTINPDGTGTYNNWVPGGTGPVSCDASIHWGCVDEGPPSPGDSDISYVIDITEVGATDTYAAQDYTLQSGYSIDEVRVYVTAKALGSATNSVAIYSGTTLDYFSADILTISYAEYFSTWVNNPDDAEVWAEVDIDALEIGSHRHGSSINEVALTLVYAQVQSSTPIYDYTAVFQFDFTGIKGDQNPYLEIAGLRTGDSESILVQALRSGSWITISSDAFDTTLTTSIIPLSTTDVLGGSASIRIIDSDTTDDTQTFIFIDEILIRTEGKASNPSGFITVKTKSEYLLWENRIRVDLFVWQSGGPEQGEILMRYVQVTIDGYQAEQPIYAIRPGENHTYIGVPWGAMDFGVHNITVIGYAQIGWTTGNSVYSSEPEKILADNLPRWALVIITILASLSIVAVILLRRAKEYIHYRQHQERQRDRR